MGLDHGQEKLLERIACALEAMSHNIARLVTIEVIDMSQTQELIDAATQETSAEQALLIVLNGWIAAFQRAQDSGNQAAVQTVINQMKANTVAMVNAVTANTVPTDDTPAPIGTDPVTGMAAAPAGTIPPNAQGTGAGQQNGPPTDASTGLAHTATDAGTPPATPNVGSPV